MATWGMPSHFLPLAPIGWAIRAAGYEIRVVSHASMVDTITSAGLPAVPVGEDLDFAEVFSTQVGKVATATATGDPVPDDETIAPVLAPDGGVVRFADAILDGLVAYGRAYQPDVLVFEPFNLAAPLAAAALGVPAVRHLWGPDSGIEIDYNEDAVIAPRAVRLGIDPAAVKLHGDLTLDPCPDPMQVPLATPRQPIRFVPYNGTAVLPEWLRVPPLRPRVCVTWGTMMSTLSLTERFGPARIAQALGDLDLEVVLALDPAEHPRLGPLPPNVTLTADRLALHLLLPSCAAVVHQAGAGTTMTALAAGIPQLVLPQVSDQHFNAARLALTGAGRCLTVEAADPATIREHVTSMLVDRAWRRSARQMRDRLAAMPAPADVVSVLQELASPNGGEHP